MSALILRGLKRVSHFHGLTMNTLSTGENIDYENLPRPANGDKEESHALQAAFSRLLLARLRGDFT
jgi:hypothetical protein